MSEMKLTAENVNLVVKECLAEEAEGEGITVVNAVVHKVAFKEDKLKERRDDIHSMLKQLPDSFQSDGGGGMSFLNACNNNEGNQWTGLHLTMEMLFAMGLAIGVVRDCVPDMQDILPGGMPYFAVLG